MLYYAGCKIPKGADCEDSCKCLKGIYCKCLEVCAVTDEQYQKGDYRYFKYMGEDCTFFHSEHEAAEYLNSIKGIMENISICKEIEIK